jgi:hypothetical protein
VSSAGSTAKKTTAVKVPVVLHASVASVATTTIVVEIAAITTAVVIAANCFPITQSFT